MSDKFAIILGRGKMRFPVYFINSYIKQDLTSCDDTLCKLNLQEWGSFDQANIPQLAPENKDTPLYHQG